MYVFLVLAMGLEFEDQIAKLSKSLDEHKRAREILLSENSEKIAPSYLEPLDYEILPEEWLLNQFIPKTVLNSKFEIKAVELIALKPVGTYKDVVNGANIAIGLVLSNGDLEIYEQSGALLYRYQIGYVPNLISATTSYDEMKIALVSKEKIEVLEISMDRAPKNYTIEKENYGPQSNKLKISISLESEEFLPKEISTILFYVKTGKKHWVTGDLIGNIEIRGFNGTVEKALETYKGKITALDRFGQELVFGSERGVGIISNQMSVPTFCNIVKFTEGHVEDLAIDTSTSTSIVYAAVGGKLVIIDVKSEENCNSKTYTVKGEVGLAGLSKVVSTKEYILALAAGNLNVFNSTGIKRENPVPLKLFESSEEEKLRISKIETGGYVVMAASKESVKLYELVTAYYESSGGFEFGNLRIFVILFAIGGAVLWQYFKKSPRR